MPTTAKRTSRVLILTSHPLLAVLLGLLIELESLAPVFADADESPEDALARMKPLSAILMDADLEAAKSDLFHLRASRRGVRVVLFRTPASAVDVQALAESRELSWTDLPVDRQTLAALLSAGAPDRRGRHERRSGASTSTASDGTLTFRDREGRRWMVFDRRGGPRRADDGTVSPGDESRESYRAFVDEHGEEWRYPLPADGPLGVTAAALERQLARARRHLRES